MCGMKKFLYTHPEESIAYVIDRISGAPEDEVFLAVDASPEVFSDHINLKLLKREADNFSKKITIVSKTPHILEIAGQAGFAVSSDDINVTEVAETFVASATPADLSAKALASAEASREGGEMPIFSPEDNENELPWMRKKTAGDATELKSEEAEEEKEVEEIIKNESLKKPSRKFFSWKFIGAALGIVTVLGAGAFYFLSPKVTLNIILKKTAFNMDFKVTVDTAVSAIDLKSSKIPGQLIKLNKEISDQFASTGKQEKESKAEGEITIYNESISSSAQRWVKTTRFKAKNGEIFRLKNDIIVPPATVVGGKVIAPGMITAAVVADQPGPQYNIEPTDFTMPVFEGTTKFVTFYGKSSSPMAGGALSGIPFATKEDLDGAKSALIAKFNKSADELAGTEAPEDMKVLPRARLEPTFDFSAGDPGADGKFTAKLKANYGVFAFSESDVGNLIEQYIAGKFSDTQQSGAESRTITYSDESLGANNLSLGFTVKVSQMLKGSLDEAKIKNDLAGKNEEEMKEVLRANEVIESAEFSFWPVWISVAPRDPEKIKISAQE